MMEVGDNIYVLEDGKPYKCKVVGKRHDSIKVHFIRFKKRYDEWINLDRDRIVLSADDISISDDLASKRKSDDEEEVENESVLSGVPRKRHFTQLDCAPAVSAQEVIVD